MNSATCYPALPSDDNQPLHLKWIAAFFGISVKSVRRMLDRKEMPSTKLNGLRVVIRSDFSAYLEKLKESRGAHGRI
jgi:hypothetical protein